MKNRTKISLILLALSISMTVSANTQAAESNFSKKVIHSLIQQSIDSTLEALTDELNNLNAPIIPIMPITSKTKTDNEVIAGRVKKQERKVKMNHTS